LINHIRFDRIKIKSLKKILRKNFNSKDVLTKLLTRSLQFEFANFLFGYSDIRYKIVRYEI